MNIARIIAILLAASAFASAEDLTGRFGAGGFFGGTAAMGSRWVRDHSSPHWNYGGWTRYGVMPELSIGASVEGVSLADKNPSAMVVLANGYYHIMPENAWNPNAHLGLGIANVADNETFHGNAFTTKLGVGVDRFIHERISVGAYLDYLFVKDQTRSTYPSHEMHTFLYGLTCGLWFGGDAPSKPKPAPKAAVPAPADSDKDGVIDSADICPDTISGTRVDVNGCPADEDRDGVLDPADKCPGTPIGARVNSMGCPRAEKVSIELLIEFDTAKWTVKTGYDSQLMKVSEFMKAHPDVTAEIEGHTDSKGKKSYNMDLSQKRAAAVRQALIDRFGVAPARLTAKGYGPTKPVASNDTEEGRTKNRRVLATFTSAP